MVTPADRQKVRAYFNAGLLVVRPEKGVLRKWGQDFTRLIEDTVLVNMCRENVDKRIFLHQTALVGAVLNTLARDELVELPASYNYPLFFEQMFEASSEFGTIDGITTLRYDVYFRNPDPRWSEKLKGPAEKIAWLKARLGKKADK
jgi:lipopolysaccharide biosynthesis glycosyltransferase